jgi:hypothetical protein
MLVTCFTSIKLIKKTLHVSIGSPIIIRGCPMCLVQLPLVNYSAIHSSIVAVCFYRCVPALYQSVRSVDVDYKPVHICLECYFQVQA